MLSKAFEAFFFMSYKHLCMLVVLLTLKRMESKKETNHKQVGISDEGFEYNQSTLKR